jgi:trk system potassium uptake protein TrkA
LYIVIVGGGRAGHSLAKTLLEEGHEVLVVDKRDEICEEINEELGSICEAGDGCDANVLLEAGVERADMFVALTGSDEDNLVACQLAKHRFSVPRTAARVNNPSHEALFKGLGIDITVSSINLVLEQIEHEVPTRFITHLVTLDSASLEIVQVKIPEGSVVVGNMVGQIELPAGALITLLLRDKQPPQRPNGDTVLQAGDDVLVVINKESEEALRLALTQEAAPEAEAE